MDLGRDLLDNELVDGEGRRLGRADSIAIEFRAAGPPRATAMLVGMRPVAHRTGRWVERIVVAAARLLNVDLTPVRVPMSTIQKIDVDVQLAVDRSTRAELTANERWLVRHVVRYIPGSGA